MTAMPDVPVQAGYAPVAERDHVRVWDSAVRVVHWSLVLLVATALYTGFFRAPSTFDLHVIAGSVIAGLVIFRLVWGFTGSTYARFASFVRGPAETAAHAGALLRGKADVHAGHNPLAAVMIVALLAAITALAVSGTVVLGGVFKDGPAAAAVSYGVGHLAKEVHEAFAFFLVGLILLHVGGAVFESLRTRENLVRAMMTGRKRRRSMQDLRGAEGARPILAMMFTGVLFGITAGGIITASALSVPGLPVAPIPEFAAGECKSCHALHHPTIAPRETWAAIMRGLGDHFGENASLDDDVTSQIAAYYDANAAETWDTKAAHVLGRKTAQATLRVTESAGWTRLHRDVPSAVFARKAVGGKLNCSACHRDAEAGLFKPRQISIPEEKPRP